MDLLDARHLTLIQHFHLHTKRRGQSQHWHAIRSRPCLCDTLHGHCRAITCPCRRHEGEISR